MQTSSSRSLALSSWRNRDGGSNHLIVGLRVRKISKTPSKPPRQESCAVFISMDVTSSASQRQRFVNRPGQFVAIHFRKRNAEANVKNLSQDELCQLEQAKRNEIRQNLQNEVMEALKGNEEIRDDELMGMPRRSRRGGSSWSTKPETWKTSCWKRQLLLQHAVLSTASCNWQRTMDSNSRRLTCLEPSSTVESNERTGTWCQ